MSVVPPPILRQPFVCTSLLRPTVYSATRSFASSSRVYIHADNTSHASTALKPGVREREAQNGQGAKVVGDEVKGAEGPHYKGE